MHIRNVTYTISLIISVLLLAHWPRTNHDLFTDRQNNSVEPSSELNKPINNKFNNYSLSFGINHSHKQSAHQIEDLKDSFGSGACVADFNNDGWMDLIFATGSGDTRYYGKRSWWSQHKPLVIYENKKGYFRPVSLDLSTLKIGATFGCAVADLNQDGQQDFILYTDSSDYLFANKGEFIFEPVNSFNELTHSAWTSHALIFDANNDGLMDVHLSHYLDYQKNIKRFESSSGFTGQSSKNFEPALFDGLSNQLLINKDDFAFVDESDAYGTGGHKERTLSSQWFISETGSTMLLTANGKGQPLRLFDLQQKREVEISGTLNGVRFLKRSPNNSKEFMVARPSGLSDLILTAQDLDLSFTPSTNSQSLVYTDTWSWESLHNSLNEASSFVQANGKAYRNAFAKFNASAQSNLCFHPGPNRLTLDETCSLSNESGSSRSIIKLDINNDGVQELITLNNNAHPRVYKSTQNALNWISLSFPVEEFLGGRVILSNRSNETYEHFIDFQSVMFGQSSPRLLVGLNNGNKVKVTIVNKMGKTILSRELSPNKHYELKNGAWHSLKFGTANNKINDKLESTPLNFLLPLVSNTSLTHLEIEEIVKRFEIAGEQEQLEASSWISIHPATSNLLPLYLRLLHSNVGAIYHAAIKAIGELEDDRTVEALISEMRLDNLNKICLIADVFQTWFSEEEAAIRNKHLAIPVLIELAGNEEVASCAINALAESDNVSAARALIHLATKSDSLLPELIRALGLLRHKQAIPLLNGIVEKADSSELVSEALIALTRLNSPKITELLLDHSQDPNNKRLNTIRQSLYMLAAHHEMNVVGLTQIKEWANSVKVNLKAIQADQTATIISKNADLNKTSFNVDECNKSNVIREDKWLQVLCDIITENKNGSIKSVKLSLNGLNQLDQENQHLVIQELQTYVKQQNQKPKILTTALLTHSSIDKTIKDEWSLSQVDYDAYTFNWLKARVAKAPSLLDTWLTTDNYQQVSDIISQNKVDISSLSKQTQVKLLALRSYDEGADGLALLKEKGLL